MDFSSCMAAEVRDKPRSLLINFIHSALAKAILWQELSQI
jgi:hypothetical protein